MYAQINRFKKSKTKEIPIYSGVKLVNEELGIEYNGSLSIIYKEKEFQVDLGHKLMVEERLVLLLEIFSKIVCEQKTCILYTSSFKIIISA